VVLPHGQHFPRDWLEALRDEVSVYREQSAREALEHAEELGAEREAARVMDREIDRALWAELVTRADPAAVSFAERSYEAAWVRGVVELGL
jgi:hypothetical protein